MSGILKTLSAVLSSAATLFVFSLIGKPNLKFREGEEYTFYVGSASSQAEIITVCGGAARTAARLKDIRGESTVYAYTSDGVEKIMDEFSAEIVFFEKCATSESVYCYSPEFSDCIMIDGRAVNLHVASDGVKIKVGSPIIFGGY